jgi:hypothetical protein
MRSRVLVLEPQDARGIWVLDLEPCLARPRSIRVLAVLGDDALGPELAGMGEDRRAVAFEVLAVADPGRRLGEQPFEPGLPLRERSRSPILAIEFQEVEGVEKRLPRGTSLGG